MLHLWLILLPLAVAGPAEEPPKGLVPAQNAEPVYKVLYESGFYQEAIDFLASKVQAPEDSLWVEYHQYLAYCYVALDQPEKARETFGSILARFPRFDLNPIQISPKIYEVFSLARERWTVKTAPTDSVPAVAAVSAQGPDRLPEWKLDRKPAIPAAVPRRDWSPALNLLPGGAGQFHHREPVKGLAFGLAQAFFLAASIYYVQRRQDFYDPEFGWYGGNEAQNRRYVLYARLTLGATAAAYAASVVEAFIHESKP